MPKSILSSLVLASTFALALGCSGKSDDSDGSGDGGGTSEGTEGGSSTGTSSTTDGTSDSTTSGAEEAGFVPGDDATTGSTTGNPPGPNGAMCSFDDECESMICVDVAGFTGLCSECRTDQDCSDAGLGTNCSIGAAGYFACGDGSAGMMCMSDAACGQGLVCAQVIDLGGLFNDSFCSECADDTACAAGELCTPTFVLDITNPAGQRECLPAGSVAHSGLCDVGSAQCGTATCEAVSVMGFLELGICGDCDSANPCPGGGTCTPGMVDLLGGGGLSGATCG